MGLDNLIDDDENESESSNQTTWDNDTSQTQDSRKEFSSPSIVDDSTGPYGYSNMDEYKNTINGEIDLHGDLFKYRMPIFSHIEKELNYQFSARYRLGNKEDIILPGGVCTCIYQRRISLSNIPRELIMLDTGETEKEKCYNVLEERFDEEINDYTTVYLVLFMKTRHITKMAIGDEQNKSWSTYPIDRQLKAVYNETYTQEFRETAGGPPNLKHTDQIGIWGTVDEFEVEE